jgi:hypothetical protein
MAATKYIFRPGTARAPGGGVAMTNPSGAIKGPTPQPTLASQTLGPNGEPIHTPSAAGTPSTAPASTVTHDRLVERSLSAALAAIEIYNKPSLAYREEAFAVLIVNAWELLLKAKLLKDADNRIESILAVNNEGKLKFSRTAKVPLTIDVLNASLKVRLPGPVAENIKALVEIRDSAVHLCCENDEALTYMVFTLAAASLKNYARLMLDWFGRSLKQYNFFVLPLAFAYNFRTLDALELDRRPDAIRQMIEAITKTQSGLDDPDGYSFVCEIRTEVRAAPKFADGADYTTAIDPKAGPGSTAHVRLQAVIDKYPLTYKELMDKVRWQMPRVRPAQVDHLLRTKVKGNPKLSAYNFRSKAHERRHTETGVLPKDIAVLYNEDVVRVVLSAFGAVDRPAGTLPRVAGKPLPFVPE